MLAALRHSPSLFSPSLSNLAVLPPDSHISFLQYPPDVVGVLHARPGSPNFITSSSKRRTPRSLACSSLGRGRGKWPKTRVRGVAPGLALVADEDAQGSAVEAQSDGRGREELVTAQDSFIHVQAIARPFPPPHIRLPSADTAMDADALRQVRVRFVTKLPPPLRAPPTAIAFPAELSHMGLSEIVNSLILSAEPDHQAQPFDFIVDGELVRMPLHQFLLAKGISAVRILARRLG